MLRAENLVVKAELVKPPLHVLIRQPVGAAQPDIHVVNVAHAGWGAVSANEDVIFINAHLAETFLPGDHKMRVAIEIGAGKIGETSPASRWILILRGYPAGIHVISHLRGIEEIIGSIA